MTNEVIFAGVINDVVSGWVLARCPSRDLCFIGVVHPGEGQEPWEIKEFLDSGLRRNDK